MHAGRGIASNHDLLVTYQKTLEGYFRMWHHHFEFLLLGYGAYLTFFGFCKKAFPEITDQTIARMVAGIDAEISGPTMSCGASPAARSTSKSMRTSRKERRSRTSWDRCARRANRAAAGSRNCRPRAIPGSTSMSATASITITAAGMTISPWRFPRCRVTSRSVRDGESLDRQVERLREERTRLIADYRELLADDQERAAYDQMIALAHRVFPYVEGHKFYCEHWYTNLFFNKIRSFGGAARGARLLRERRGRVPSHALRARGGHHRPDECLVERLKPRGPAYWPPIVAERRAASPSGPGTKPRRRSVPFRTSSMIPPS